MESKLISLMHYSAKFIGLAPFTMKNNRFYPATMSDKLYPLIVAVIYLIFISMSSFEETKLVTESFSQLTKVTGTLYYVVVSAVVFLTLIIFSSMSEKIIDLMNKLCEFAGELKNLGVEEDHKKLLKNIAVTTLAANTVLFTACLIEDLLEPVWPINVSIAYNLKDFICSNTILIFVQILLRIKRRFKLINAKLYDVMKLGRLRTENLETFLVRKNALENLAESVNHDDILERIRKIEFLHLELCSLVNQTTHVFASPILLNTCSFFGWFISCGHWIYFVDRNAIQSDVERNVWWATVSISSFMIRTIILIITIFVICYTTVTTCREGNATKIALVEVSKEFDSAELKDEFLMFSLQLLHTPVTVSAFGFFDLNYSYIYKIFCAVLAYLIIVIQLDTSRSNSGV